MVFIKKANKGKKLNQNVQGKRPVNVEVVDMTDDDVDDEMDSDGSEDALVFKTPKGKQTPNEKRVSFQVPGKNTPKTPLNKKQATPAKETSVSKKQATPGKGGLQKFTGVEQEQNEKPKKDNDFLSDDDSDEEDPDYECDLELGNDSDIDEEYEDDDDEEEEDDDDDDDIDNDDVDKDDDEDDDDDDEEEEASNKKQSENIRNKKQNVQTKQTPMKKNKQNEDSDDSEEDDEESNQKISIQSENQKKSVAQANQTPTKKVVQTPKTVQTPNSKANQTKTNALAVLEEERRRQRDVTQLYLGNLPKNVAMKELKNLSPDILSVYVPTRRHASKSFAFLQFASEEKAEENYKKLKTQLFKGSPLVVDYVGTKSSHQPKENTPINLKKLFVSGLPLDATVSQVAKFFPKCHTVALNQCPTYRAATVSFFTEADGTAAFQETKNIKLGGMQLSVLHSRSSKQNPKRKRSAARKNKDNGRATKKMKKEESSDEE